MSNEAFIYLNRFDREVGVGTGWKMARPMPAEEEKRAGEFRGILIDTGCNERSTFSTGELEKYMRTYRTVPEIEWSRQGKIRGLSGPVSCLGKTRIVVPFVDLGVNLEFELTIVEGDQPTLLCLRDMKRTGIDVSIQEDTVTIAGLGREKKLVLQNFQLWHKWKPEDTKPESYFTIQEAEKLHRSFEHPSTRKLYDKLERAGPERMDGVRKMLDAVQANCTVCAENAAKPQRYRLSATDPDLRFNSEVLVDVMYVRAKPVLHVVDQATKLQAAAVLRSVSADSVWNTLTRLWLCTYLGPPDVLRVDRGAQFVSNLFVSEAKDAGNRVEIAPTECPTELSTVERYHGSLRAVFERIASPETSDEDALQYAVYTLNTTMGLEGLVPMLLVFGSLPRPARSVPALTQLECAKRMESARDEVARVHARNRLQVGLRYRGPYAVERADLRAMRKGDSCLVYRPKEKKWLKYDFIAQEGETVTVRNPATGSRSLFRSNVVKAAPKDSDVPAEERKQLDTIAFAKAAVDGDFTDARKAELHGLVESKVFKVVKKSEMQKGDRLFKSRFMDTRKGDGTMKSRLVSCNFNDEGATSIQTRSPTVSRSAQRVAFSFAASAIRKGRSVYVRDISQAYTQSAEDLKRRVYLRAAAEMGLSDEKVLLCVRPLYGVPEAGLFWFATYAAHHTGRLGMALSRADPRLCTKRDASGESVVVLQVDESLGFGTNEFLDAEEREVHRFKCRPRTLLGEGEVAFNGVTISVNKTCGDVSVHQRAKLENIDAKARSLEEMVSVRAALQYIGTCARPDLLGPTQCLAANLAEPDAPSKQTVKAFKALLDAARVTAATTLRYMALDEERVEVIVVTDASFAMERDHKSRLGFVILLDDGSGRANIVDWSSCRSPRVTRSVIAAELLAPIHGYDRAYLIREMVTEIRGVSASQIPLRAGVDSKTVFDPLARRNITLERRLQIDMAALKEAQDIGDLRELFWFPREFNLSDPLTQRHFIKESALVKLMRSNELVLPSSRTFFVCEKRQTQEGDCRK